MLLFETDYRTYQDAHEFLEKNDLLRTFIEDTLNNYPDFFGDHPEFYISEEELNDKSYVDYLIEDGNLFLVPDFVNTISIDDGDTSIIERYMKQTSWYKKDHIYFIYSTGNKIQIYELLSEFQNKEDILPALLRLLKSQRITTEDLQEYIFDSEL